MKFINSIMNHTYTHLEIILVDDGSPDSSGRICDEYANMDNQIIVIHKENISVEESYDLASQYIEALPYYYAKGVREAFRAITKSEWLEGVNKYLSQPHKK